MQRTPCCGSNTFRALPTAKTPRGRHQQAQPKHITVRSSDGSDSVGGRLIAVNKNYICYAMTDGIVRILDFELKKTPSLLRGHTQRVTDMAFSSDDVHVLASASAEGKVFVWKITEGPDKDGKNQIAGKVVIALHFTGDWESIQPRLSWWKYRPDTLVIGIGKYVLTVDVNKFKLLASRGSFSVEDPIECSVTNPVDGVRVLGVHEEEVTGLSPYPGMARFASSSMDGTVRIWGDSEILAPHAGQAVTSLAFLSSPLQDRDHVVLLTAGPLSREVKLWYPHTSDGTTGWKCSQTLELKSSLEGHAFFNQLVVVPQASFIMLANAKRNSIYVVHLEFGSSPSMDYLAEFSVKMPILSFTATCDGTDGDGVMQIYCVQTQAIRQYSLDMALCKQDRDAFISSSPYTTPTSVTVPAAKTPPKTAIEKVDAPSVTRSGTTKASTSSEASSSSAAKTPRGRHLSGERVAYDIDTRVPEEAQPQLEVSPITVDRSGVVGKIAVNRSYVCYGQEGGDIGILNINKRSRDVLRGHTQRVTDMAFLSDEVDVLASASAEGKVFVRQIRGSAEDGKNQIEDHVLVALHLIGNWESVQPRLSWWKCRPDTLIVSIGNYILTVNVDKLMQSRADCIKCLVTNPIDGVRMLGWHDDEVTGLSPYPGRSEAGQMSCFASSSNDGTVRIWSGAQLASLAPHAGQAVKSVAFLSPLRDRDHVVLLTAGPLSREVKLWYPYTSDGTTGWKCLQTLELKSSLEGRPEDAFFNQLVVVPQASFVILGNAKRNSIYVVQLEFGSSPATTQMDYLAEFSVKMPILSFTATCDGTDGDGVMQIYCIHTQAIQHYSLDIALCTPKHRSSPRLATDVRAPHKELRIFLFERLVQEVLLIRKLQQNREDLSSRTIPIPKEFHVCILKFKQKL